MGVFSDDFAAVDFCEVLCYHSLTEKADSEEIILPLECKKTGVISLEALHPYLSKIIEFDAKITIKTAF